MLTLQEAIASGSKYRKVGSTGAYGVHTSFGVADVTAKYELEPETGVSITKSKLIAAWNASVPTSGSVAVAAESAMFGRMLSKLGL